MMMNPTIGLILVIVAGAERQLCAGHEEDGEMSFRERVARVFLCGNGNCELGDCARDRAATTACLWTGRLARRGDGAAVRVCGRSGVLWLHHCVLHIVGNGLWRVARWSRATVTHTVSRAGDAGVLKRNASKNRCNIEPCN